MEKRRENILAVYSVSPRTIIFSFQQWGVISTKFKVKSRKYLAKISELKEQVKTLENQLMVNSLVLKKKNTLFPSFKQPVRLPKELTSPDEQNASSLRK